MNLLGVLEGVLFVVGDEGITLNQICEILNVEMEEAKNALNILGMKMISSEQIKLPKIDADRTIIIYKKEKNTINKYPRKAGTPAKEPLK